MAPYAEAFHASSLTEKINKLPNGKPRKPQIKNLKDCELKELIQYNCELNGPVDDPASKVVCEPVLRLFRQCANGATIETTAWEDRFDGTIERTSEVQQDFEKHVTVSEREGTTQCPGLAKRV